METIIQQIALNFTGKIIKKTLNGGLSDLDALSSDVFSDCKETAVEIIQTIISQVNLELRSDKEARKEMGLVLKEKDRPREIYTELGTIGYSRDYYHDRSTGGYASVLDEMMGVRKYSRIGDTVRARLVSEAAEVSYAKSSRMVTEGRVSRQTVRNLIIGMTVPQTPVPEERRTVSELHLHADEDHVHMQKPGRQKGRRNRILPIVTVTEGTEEISAGRRRTLNAKHFVGTDTAELWRNVSGYISAAYDTDEIESIYIHGDGGRWIRNGLDPFAQAVHVMDGFHYGRERRSFRRDCGQSAGQILDGAVRKGDRQRADLLFQELLASCEDGKEAEGIRRHAMYFMGNWDAIEGAVSRGMEGSCTEAMVSHVLSERFSRNPMGWSEEALEKLSGIRVYLKNGGRLTAGDMRPGAHDEERYSEYADRLIAESVSGSFDWSIFEPQQLCMDHTSGTQILMDSIGEMRRLQ